MSDWAAKRSEDARIQHERLQARQETEHRKAEDLVRVFMTAVDRRRPEPEPLRVQGYGGRGSARTPLRGWYLRVDRTAALSVEGAFYLLIAPLSVVDRLRGVQPSPTRPPLVLGAGGKDGDSIDLVDALERVLPGWRDLGGSSVG